MNLSRDQVSTITVRAVERSAIKVGTELITGNVLLFRDQVELRDLPDDIGRLTEGHLQDLLALEPEVVIIGSGWAPGRAPRELVFALARRGIGLEVMDTPAACRTFNILLSEGRDVAAVLIVSGETGAAS